MAMIGHLDIPLSDIDVDHHVQRQVLMQLRQHGPESYVALKPDGMEGNAFNYHLKSLKRAGLVTLEDKIYHLTATGQLVTDSFSFDRQRTLLRPHHYIYPLVVAGDKVLVYEVRRPLLEGKLALPAGKMHYGDDDQTSLQRELKRRGIDDKVSSRMLCGINIRYQRSGETVMHRPGVVWSIAYNGELVETTTPSGASRWYARDELRTNPCALPDVLESLSRLENGDTSPIDLTYLV